MELGDSRRGYKHGIFLRISRGFLCRECRESSGILSEGRKIGIL